MNLGGLNSSLFELSFMNDVKRLSEILKSDKLATVMPKINQNRIE